MSYDATIHIPAVSLAGFSFYIAFVTVGSGYQSGIKYISLPVKVDVVS